MGKLWGVLSLQYCLMCCFYGLLSLQLSDHILVPLNLCHSLSVISWIKATIAVADPRYLLWLVQILVTDWLPLVVREEPVQCLHV